MGWYGYLLEPHIDKWSQLTFSLHSGHNEQLAGPLICVMGMAQWCGFLHATSVFQA